MVRCEDCHNIILDRFYCEKCYKEAADLWNYMVMNHPRIHKRFLKDNTPKKPKRC